MKYCEVAFELEGVKVVCGSKCPLISNCPVLILEDAADTGINKAIKALMKIKKIKENGK